MKKPVAKIREGGEVIHRYESISEAARRCGVHPSAISHSLKGKCRAAGFYWAYTDTDKVLSPELFRNFKFK